MKKRQSGLFSLAIAAICAFALSSCSSPISDSSPKAENQSGWSVDTHSVASMLSSAVADQQVAGVVALIRRDGKEIFFTAEGMADGKTSRAMTRDTLFQIYSMSNPLTGVALMTLYEQGRFNLDDPLSKYLPEFADMTVFEGMDESGTPILVKAKTPITIRQVVSHSAGFGYRSEGDSYVDRAFAKDEPLDYDNTLTDMSKRLAELPLYYHPGRQWRYSIAVDVQARLIEVLSGQSFHSYLQDHVLTPLGMTDTHRFLNDREKARLARGYFQTAPGELSQIPDDDRFYAYNFEPHPLEIGGYGLVTTIDDYAKFARMLLNGGTLANTQILKPDTVKLMSTDLLDWPLDDTHFLRDKGQLGFGVDFAVRTAPPASPDEQAGAVGEFFWDGYASTLFWVDPVNDLTAILLVQKLPFDSDLHRRFRNAVYAGSPHSPPE